MKRLFLATLLVLIVSAFFVLPAFAADECADMPGMHDPTPASLRMHTDHANQMGHIKDQLMPGLMAQLNVANDETLSSAARAGALKSYIGLVNAQAGKGINADCASHLVTQAQQAIAGLPG